ncbi:MAG: hypothetical protein JKY51_03900 [Opitutaceae bacterium]|nr:hypothetical protein [Opitutaceae bacterium]
MPKSPPQYPLLILDTASAKISVGLRLNQSDAGIWFNSDEKAGVSIFRGIQFCLEKSPIQLENILSIIYCEGPGSILGIRTATMALRTWIHTAASPLSIYRYKSLSLAAAGLGFNNTETSPFSVILDARRGRWHTLTTTQQDFLGEIKSIDSNQASLIPHTIFYPKGFPLKTSLPFTYQECDYTPSLLSNTALLEKIVQQTISPDVFITGETTYQKWTPELTTKPGSSIKHE